METIFVGPASACACLATSPFVTVSNQPPVLFRPSFLTATLQSSWARTRDAGMPNKMDTRALDKRNIKRTKMVVGLRVSQQRSHAADLIVHTLDISSSGAKIGAFRECMQPGSTLIVQRRQTRARCLVMWSRTVAPGEIQVGIKFLGGDSRFWDLDLDEDCAGVWFSESER